MNPAETPKNAQNKPSEATKKTKSKSCNHLKMTFVLFFDQKSLIIKSQTNYI